MTTDWHKLDVGALRKRGKYKTKSATTVERLGRYRVDPRDAATVNGAFKQFVDEFEFPVTGFDIFTVATVVEAGLVRRVLWEFGGHMSEAARFMGINRTTLYEKCRKLGINSRDFRRQRVAASAPRISSE